MTKDGERVGAVERSDATNLRHPSALPNVGRTDAPEDACKR